MKSQKRKTTKPQNVLIAFNKGIASSQSIELAMLFSHAGFDVKSIFFDGAEEYVSTAAIKEITDHSPWSDDHKPGWIKADFTFATGIVIEPDTELWNRCLETDFENLEKEAEKDNTSSNSPELSQNSSKNVWKTREFLNCINARCQRIKILTHKENLEKFINARNNLEVIALPDNPLNIKKIFEQILSDTTKYIATKSLDKGLTYSFEGKISDIDYIPELEKAFAEYGIEHQKADGCEPQDTEFSPSMSLFSKIIVSKDNKKIEIVLEDGSDKQPDESLIYINKHKNGLILTDKTETRLLPQFSCKSCYSKFMEYLKVELSRNN